MPLLRLGHRPLRRGHLLLQLFGAAGTAGLFLFRLLRFRLDEDRGLEPFPLLGGPVLLKGPPEINDLSVLQHPDTGGKAVDEVAVVGDKEQIALVALHRLLNPLPAGHVQVVGGLVQDQQIDLLVHEHTQAQAALLPAGEGGHGLEHVLPPEVEGRQPIAGRLGGAVLVVDHGVHQIALRVGEADDLRQVPHLYSRSHA